MRTTLLHRVLALCLSVILGVSACVPAFAAPAPQQAPDMISVAEYEAFIKQTQERSAAPGFYRFLRSMRSVFRFFFGQALMPDRNFNVEIDPLIDKYCAYIAANSDLDVKRIMTNLPETSKPAELIVTVFHLDTTQLRDQMFRRRDTLWRQGKHTQAMIYYFLGVYFSIMDRCDVKAEDTDEPDVHEVVLSVTYRDGKQQELRPGIFINDVTGECYNRDGKGMVGTGFNCSIYDLLVYAPVNAWMRDFGFCIWYDLACYISPDWMWNYTTRRFKFRYDNRDWMIQIWKGSYLITNGGEIGIYNRDKYRIGSYYDCVSDEDMLEMSMTVSHGDEVLVDLPTSRHWWINGFKMGSVRYKPSSLTMRATIVMRDEAMRDAFCKAIDRNYRRDVKYTTDGLNVYLDW